MTGQDGLEKNYEDLEVLGDAILDLIIQGNLVQHTVKERHLSSVRTTGIDKDLIFDPVDKPFKAFHAH